MTIRYWQFTFFFLNSSHCLFTNASFTCILSKHSVILSTYKVLFRCEVQDSTLIWHCWHHFQKAIGNKLSAWTSERSEGFWASTLPFSHVQPVSQSGSSFTSTIILYRSARTLQLAFCSRFYFVFLLPPWIVHSRTGSCLLLTVLQTLWQALCKLESSSSSSAAKALRDSCRRSRT